MPRTWLVLLPLLAGCPRDEAICDPSTETGITGGEDVPCEESELPLMALSETELDFGDVAPGELVTRTVDIVNDGAYPLGVSSLEIGDVTVDFAVTYDLDPATCASAPDATDADNYAFVLDPGCALPLTVTYTATSPGEVWDALVVRSNRHTDPATSGFQGDLVHGQRVVWLRGATDGEPEGDAPYIVGNVIWFEQTAVIEGETIRMGVRAYSPVGSAITYDWSTDEGGGAIVDRHLPEVEYVAPEMEEGGARMNVYAVIYDDDGNQDWAFGRVDVWDEAAPLYGECPDTDPVVSGGCSGSSSAGASGFGGGGCGEDVACVDEPGCGGGAAVFLALGAFGLSRRRRA
jgi:hypothetical protein